LSPVVTDEDGRIVEVHPDTQIVRPMVAWVTVGLTAPGVRAELGRTAPAALTVMPPVLFATTGPALTAVVGMLVVGELAVAGLGDDEASLTDVVGLSCAAVGFGAEPPHPATRETARITTDAHIQCLPARQVMAAP
jgi:hypothetical protein